MTPGRRSASSRAHTTLSTEPRYLPTPVVAKGTLPDAVQDRLFLCLMTVSPREGYTGRHRRKDDAG